MKNQMKSQMRHVAFAIYKTKINQALHIQLIQRLNYNFVNNAIKYGTAESTGTTFSIATLIKLINGSPQLYPGFTANSFIFNEECEGKSVKNRDGIKRKKKPKDMLIPDPIIQRIFNNFLQKAITYKEEEGTKEEAEDITVASSEQSESISRTNNEIQPMTNSHMAKTRKMPAKSISEMSLNSVAANEELEIKLSNDASDGKVFEMEEVSDCRTVYCKCIII